MKDIEKFELEVFFSNNIKDEFIDSSHNNDKFKFQAILNGIKPRSIENAKKIIESETYEFNHPLSFKEELVGVEQHIKATMFPTNLDPNYKQQFALRTDLKNRKQASHIIKKGLNKIETILKPQATNLTNIFKRMIGAGNIDVVIKIKYHPL